MLIPLRPRSRNVETIIDDTISLQLRLDAHNSGYGKYARAVDNMRPFCLLAYICGFEGYEVFRQAVRRQWQNLDRDLKRSGEVCPLERAKEARVIITFMEANYGIKLRLVVFSDDE